jgi:hypothetical protein
VNRARQLPGFRLTVSLRNLSGLNERLGHSGADAFYASAAEILDRRLHALDADVNGFRSQGTMTFAVVARSSRTGASTLRTSILEAMRDAEVHVRGVAGGYALGKLPSPRGGAQGTGLQFDEKTDLVPLETAPATEDGARRPEPVRPSRGPSAGGFESEPELRHRRFVAAAEQLRLTREQAEVLWRVAGGEASDALAGFGSAGDRLPTVERASASPGPGSGTRSTSSSMSQPRRAERGVEDGGRPAIRGDDADRGGPRADSHRERRPVPARRRRVLVCRRDAGCLGGGRRCSAP